MAQDNVDECEKKRRWRTVILVIGVREDGTERLRKNTGITGYG